MDEEVNEFEIDYTKVYKPTVFTRRRLQRMENEAKDMDYDEIYGEKPHLKEKYKGQEKKKEKEAEMEHHKKKNHA